MPVHPLTIVGISLGTVVLLAAAWLFTVDVLSRQISANVSRELAAATAAIQKAQAEAIQEAIKQSANGGLPLAANPSPGTSSADQLQQLFNESGGNSKDALQQYLSGNASPAADPLQNMLLQKLFSKKQSPETRPDNPDKQQ